MNTFAKPYTLLIIGMNWVNVCSNILYVVFRPSFWWAIDASQSGFADDQLVSLRKNACSNKIQFNGALGKLTSSQNQRRENYNHYQPSDS